ncbi:hypothetical protein [Nonomuraea sp. LPB2021202275-12-8]|uniref:hypothetical protein n=1 Tax=Nonomuraea sp. LPB2021202275-12-8 TaxID=3120159 RepID=UPI00300C79CE
MNRRIVAALLIAGLIGMSGLAVVASTAGSFLDSESGCAGAEERLLPALTSLAILDQAPGQAVPQGDRSTGCEPDDQFVYVGQSYRFSGARADVLSFYEQHAAQYGWRRAPVTPSEPQDKSLCYTGSIGGARTFAYVWFPADSGLASPDEYNVTVSAREGETPDNGVMC